jgi:hypothetical protein
MRILLDQNVPVGVQSTIFTRRPDAEIRLAYDMGWARLQNGELLARAEDSGFDLLLTADQNMAYQRNMTARKIRLVVLRTNRWAELQADPERVVATII